MNAQNKSYQHQIDHLKKYPEDRCKLMLNHSTINRWRQERIYHIIDPLLKMFPDSEWLTVGDFYYGTDAQYIRSKGFKVVASDVDDHFLKKGKEIGYIDNYSKENVESLSYSDGQFDFVLCKETLHHLPRPYIGLYEMLRVSKIGIVVIEPYDRFINASPIEKLGNWPVVYGLVRNVWDSPKLRQLIYGERMLAGQLPSAFEYLKQHWPKHPDPVIAATKFEWRQKMVNDLLWQEDRVSMAHGLEVRTPLVDRVLYSHVDKFPRDELMRNGKPKAYLKATVSAILPQQILNRPKSGFQVASFDFYHKHLTRLAQEQLNEKTVKEVGLFNYKFISHVLKFSPTKRLRWHYFILYFMILTHLWVQLFENGQWTEKP